MSVDHYGVPFSAIEPGEIDQEQHDGVRDVFFVSHATMLVRADLFTEFGGFDEDAWPGSDDIDLCWRARLAGARVLVAPGESRAPQAGRRARRAPDAPPHAPRRACRDARPGACALQVVLDARAPLGAAERLRAHPRRSARRWRSRGAGGTRSRSWAAGSRRRGGFAAMRRGRRETQAIRQVEDADVRDLMVRGSARFRSLLVQRLHAGDRLADASTARAERVAETRDQLRRAPAILALTVGVLLLIGSRALIFQRVPEIGNFQSWPGVGSLWSTFTSPWRYTMVGSRTPATPAFAMMSALSTVLLGHVSLARTVVVVGAIPFGAWGTYRLVRTLTARDAARGRRRDRVRRRTRSRATPSRAASWARSCASRSRRSCSTRWCASREPIGRRRPPTASAAGAPALRTIVVVGMLGGVAGAVWPPAILLAVLIAVGVRGLAAVRVGRLGHPADRGSRAARRGREPVAARAVGRVAHRCRRGDARAARARAVVVLRRHPLRRRPRARGLVHARPARRGRGAARDRERPAAHVGDAGVDHDAGVVRPGVGPDARLRDRASARAAGPAGAGRARASRSRPGSVSPPLLADMRSSRFGWRQVSAVACVVGLALPLLALAADTTSGRWRLPSTDWPTSVAWMRDLPSPGGFRVLWLGDPSVLPVDAKVVDGIGFGLTRDGPGDARTQWAAPENGASDTLAAALVAARGGRHRALRPPRRADRRAVHRGREPLGAGQGPDRPG